MAHACLRQLGQEPGLGSLVKPRLSGGKSGTPVCSPLSIGGGSGPEVECAQQHELCGTGELLCLKEPEGCTCRLWEPHVEVISP